MLRFLNPRSIAKAAKDLGMAVGTVASVAGLLYLQDPEATAAFVVAFGPFGAVVGPGLFALAKYGLDRLKHGPAE